MNTGVATLWAGGNNREVAAASMTAKLVFIGMEHQGQEAIRAEGLPTTVVADSHRGGAAAVMEDEALLLAIQRPLDRGDKPVANEAISCKLGSIFEIKSMNLSVFVRFNGELVERDDGIMLLAEIIIGDERGGGAKNGA